MSCRAKGTTSRVRSQGWEKKEHLKSKGYKEPTQFNIRKRKGPTYNWERFEQTFLKSKWAIGKKKNSSFTNYQGNAN